MLKLKFNSLICLSLFTLLTSGGPGITKTFTVTANSMAKLTRVTGTVQLLSKNKWINIKKNRIIKINDHLKTAAKSRAELTFSDGTRIRLSENTSIILIKSNKTKKNNFLKIFKGELWANIFNNKQRKFAIESTTATLAVLGTTFSVEAAQTKTDVSVFEGSVGIQLSTNNIEQLNNNLNNLKLKADINNKPGNFNKAVEINKPVHEIEKPVKIVAGPYEVSQDKWLEVIENQKISIDNKGIGIVSDLEPTEVKDDEWIKWNKDLDTNTAENILFSN